MVRSFSTNRDERCVYKEVKYYGRRTPSDTFLDSYVSSCPVLRSHPCKVGNLSCSSNFGKVSSPVISTRNSLLLLPSPPRSLFLLGRPYLATTLFIVVGIQRTSRPYPTPRGTLPRQAVRREERHLVCVPEKRKGG